MQALPNIFPENYITVSWLSVKNKYKHISSNILYNSYPVLSNMGGLLYAWFKQSHVIFRTIDIEASE